MNSELELQKPMKMEANETKSLLCKVQDKWLSIDVILEMENDNVLKKYLLIQLQLFTKLGYHKNSKWGTYLKNTFEQTFLLNATFDSKYPLYFKTICLQLFIALYMDTRESNGLPELVGIVNKKEKVKTENKQLTRNLTFDQDLVTLVFDKILNQLAINNVRKKIN